ncbi:hypothetical protein [Hasllibacter sp. MH4015]|uniref:hypothetical protein n=1 Tax=Hasllibacter sp. MH4015 TaxID=2854029 RepID=UPI001CD500C6|nr:hypothetical protein [Hasllibacter sp. MH4015]
MSTPISRPLLRTSLSLGLVGLLSACLGIGADLDGAPRDVQVTTDAVTIAGPPGFCVDPDTTRDTGDTGFVLLGNCAAISGNARARQPDVPAILTAAISAPSDGTNLVGNLPALDAFFRSQDGRALLSRSGDADQVEILASQTREGMFFLHARDTSPGALSGVAQDYWRAYLQIGPRLATLSVLALEDRDVDNADALTTLDRFARAVRAANAQPADATNAADLPQAAQEAEGGLFRAGLFRRIFQ